MSLRDTFPLAVVMGRFQVPRLHNGHIQLVAAAQAHAQCVSMKTDMLIVIGVSPALPNKVNPLSFEARRAMISAQFEGFPLEHILPLKDRGDDDLWSRDLDTLIEKHAGGDRSLSMAHATASSRPARTRGNSPRTTSRQKATTPARKSARSSQAMITRRCTSRWTNIFVEVSSPRS